MERVARLFVGIGFAWVAIIVVWAFMAGVEQPYVWFKWADDGLGYAWMRPAYLGLALVVVPVGLVTFLWDIMRDPVAVWVKWAMPGAFLAIYAFFLLAAFPNLGQPLFLGMESVVNPGGGRGLAPGAPGGTVAWLVRLGVTIVVWAGIPGGIGAVVGIVTGSKAGARRR